MMTSFAQNLEDVLLFRALGEIEHGFYIDVGANDPVIDSVTKVFSQRGWHGVNIEPSPHWLAKIAADRPRDVNLNIAVSDRPGAATFHEIAGSGLSTLRPDIATRHAASGMALTAYDVQVDTLRAICEAHAAETIHFLKVDVEGAEENALRGADFRKYRPWIVLVEATEPMTETPSHDAWHPLLAEADYDFALFDGLNRYYVAREKSELQRCFSVPADAYEKIGAVWALGHWRRIAEQREAELARLRSELAALAPWKGLASPARWRERANAWRDRWRGG